MSKTKVVDVVKEILRDFLEANGYMLFNIEYQKEGKDWILRVYIDNEEESISIEDCEKVSIFLGKELDERDIIDKKYMLEVSSPGIDRPLLKDSDYEKYKGRIVDVFLYKSLNGEKIITGELGGLIDDEILVKDEKTNEELKISRELISKVKLAVIF
ncbi:MAG: ribosome maturation factor RimP [Clostridia bacterium]|nr:ribosome maturation factor RimP [Clostridia bacterium]